MEEEINKQTYVLLDLAGNVEDEQEMTAAEAKKNNDFILEHEQRLIRWSLKKNTNERS